MKFRVNQLCRDETVPETLSIRVYSVVCDTQQNLVNTWNGTIGIFMTKGPSTLHLCPKTDVNYL